MGFFNRHSEAKWGASCSDAIDDHAYAITTDMSSTQSMLRAYRNAIVLRATLDSPSSIKDTIERIRPTIVQENYDGTNHTLEEESWTLTVHNPCLMRISESHWLLDVESIKSSMNWNAWREVSLTNREDTTPLPLLIATGPQLEWGGSMLQEPPIGTILRFELRGHENDAEAQFSMVGSVGDAIHWEGVSWIQTETIGDRNKYPLDYLVAGIALDTVEVEGTDSNDATRPSNTFGWIPTYRDKRKPLVVDRTKGKAAVWHDDLRCERCNGRVVLKFPRGNQISSCRCPHGLANPDFENHDMTFPHLVDDRTLHEGEDSVENVPKEA